MKPFRDNTSFVLVYASIWIVFYSKDPAAANHIHTFWASNKIPRMIAVGGVEFRAHCVSPMFNLHRLLISRWCPMRISLQARCEIVPCHRFTDIIFGSCCHRMLGWNLLCRSYCCNMWWLCNLRNRRLNHRCNRARGRPRSRARNLCFSWRHCSSRRSFHNRRWCRFQASGLIVHCRRWWLYERWSRNRYKSIGEIWWRWRGRFRGGVGSRLLKSFIRIVFLIKSNMTRCIETIRDRF